MKLTKQNQGGADSMQDERLQAKVQELVAALQNAVNQKYQRNGYQSQPDTVTAKERAKYIAIDIGSSGCFLVEKETGELFNIKGYGVPDKNKKRKADIGNIFTADLQSLFAVRYNYLR